MKNFKNRMANGKAGIIVTGNPTTTDPVIISINYQGLTDRLEKILGHVLPDDIKLAFMKMEQEDKDS